MFLADVSEAVPLGSALRVEFIEIIEDSWAEALDLVLESLPPKEGLVWQIGTKAQEKSVRFPACEEITSWFRNAYFRLILSPVLIVCAAAAVRAGVRRLRRPSLVTVRHRLPSLSEKQVFQATDLIIFAPEPSCSVWCVWYAWQFGPLWQALGLCVKKHDETVDSSTSITGNI